MRFGKSAIITLSSNVLVYFASIILSVITSRVLGTTGKGVIGLCNNIIALFLICIDLGIGSATIYFIGKYKDKINEIVTLNIIITILEFIIMLIIYMISIQYKFVIFEGLDRVILLITLLTIPIISLKNALIGVNLILDKIVLYNKLNIFFSFMNLILTSIFVFSIKSVLAVVTVNLISNTIILFIILFVIFYREKIKISFNFNFIFKEIIKYGVKSQLANLAQLLTYRIDIFLINYFLNVSEVGIYSNSVSLAETMWQIPGTISTLLYSKVSNTKNRSEIVKITNKICRISLSFIIICSFFLAVISKYLILILYGNEFIKSATALVLLLPGICLLSVSKILSSSLSGMGLVGKNMLISIVTCIATVCLDLSLIPNNGINGAALASCIAYTFSTVVTVVIYKNITNSNIYSIILITKTDIQEIKHRIINRSKKFV